MSLSEAQSHLLAKMVSTVGDSTLFRLNAALRAASAGDPLFAPVGRIAAAEVEDRTLRDGVLEPLRPLTEAAAPPRRRLLVPEDIVYLWRAIKTASPREVADLAAGRGSETGEEDYPQRCDALCRSGAALLRSPPAPVGSPPIAPLRREALGRLLELTPILRACRPRLGAWARIASPENTAAVRLAYRDAGSLADDAGETLMEAFLVYLDDPFQLIRLMSCLSDRPSDRFLIESELGGLGARLLTALSERVDKALTFTAPRPGSHEDPAASLVVAISAIAAFEENLLLEGAWRARIGAMKKALAAAAERRLKEVKPALSLALPLEPAGGRRRPGPPRVDAAASETALLKAGELLAFVSAVRGAAAELGFATVRAKVSTQAEEYLSAYCDEGIELLRRERGAPGETAAAYLEAAAGLTQTLLGPEPANLVRRRAAAAKAV